MDAEEHGSLGDERQSLPAEVSDHLRRLYQVPPGSVAEAKARFRVRSGVAPATLVDGADAVPDDPRQVAEHDRRLTELE